MQRFGMPDGCVIRKLGEQFYVFKGSGNNEEYLWKNGAWHSSFRDQREFPGLYDTFEEAHWTWFNSRRMCCMIRFADNMDIHAIVTNFKDENEAIEFAKKFMKDCPEQFVYTILETTEKSELRKILE